MTEPRRHISFNLLTDMVWRRTRAIHTLNQTVVIGKFTKRRHVCLNVPNTLYGSGTRILMDRITPVQCGYEGIYSTIGAEDLTYDEHQPVSKDKRCPKLRKMYKIGGFRIWSILHPCHQQRVVHVINHLKNIVRCLWRFRKLRLIRNKTRSSEFFVNMRTSAQNIYMLSAPSVILGTTWMNIYLLKVWWRGFLKEISHFIRLFEVQNVRQRSCRCVEQASGEAPRTGLLQRAAETVVYSHPFNSVIG